MTVATTADPLTLLVLIVAVLATFTAAGWLIEARARYEDEFRLRRDTVDRLTDPTRQTDRGWREARP